MVLTRSADSIKSGWDHPACFILAIPEMLRGRQFRLCRDTVALLLHDGKGDLVHIPCGAVMTLLCEKADEEGTVGIFWDGKIFWMFLVDIEERGEFFADRATAKQEARGAY